jgi:hypothetical protein
MIVFIGMGLFIGGLLGARYTVLALIPASALALSIPALVWAGHAPPQNWNLFHLGALLLFLQVGYLCGAGLRLCIRPLRVLDEKRALRNHR